MAGKVYTLKPTINYPAPQANKKRAEEKVSLKERVVETFETFLLVLLFSIFMVATMGVAYKSFIYFKIKREKSLLLTESSLLEEELKKLTAREVVLEKARELGLRPPTEKDYIHLK